jgi:uncharacterized protein (DUF433 family)
MAMSVDLLESGIYTIPEVAELVDAKQDEVRVWVEGRPGKQRPVIENEIGRLGKKVAVSFTNLMELRFVAYFSNAGVRLNEIRAILKEAKATLNHPHPFATNVVFRTDRKKIVAEIADKNGVKNIYDLKSKNYEMRDVVLCSLEDDVTFDPRGDAIAWRPRPHTAPNVYLHPSISFGQPVLMPSRTPTDVVAKAVMVEGSATVVADLYEIPLAQVREAVAFEKNLRMAA